MPYITAEEVKTKRNAIKKALPNFKFSITRENHSSINVAFLEGDIDLMGDSERSYESVNHFYIQEHYEDRPEIRDILMKAYKIASESQRELVNDSDYGSVPTFYVNITIGKWDKPYQLKA